MHECIASRNITEFKRLLHSSSVDVNAKDANGNTPLIHATIDRSIEMVGALLKAGADQNLQNNEGMTPLMVATKDRNLELSAVLIKNGDANGALQDNIGETALMKILRPPNDRDPHNEIIIVEGPLIPALMTTMFAVNKRINSGLKPKRSVLKLQGLDIQNLKGETALMYAVRLGHVEPVRGLLAAGASIDIQDNNGNTALKIAVKEGFDKVANLLVDFGACQFDDCTELFSKSM